jgi:hypothetical protein
MELVTILGYIGALFIGLVLGLTGGGGSILTVPILVYLILLDPIVATAYSLFIVGMTSLVGTLRNIPKKNIDFKIALVFSIPAFTAVYLTRKYFIQLIPEQIFHINDFVLYKDVAIMVLFALVMLLAAYSMIKTKKESKEVTDTNLWLLGFQALIVGLFTGLVGAGGGFLIVPALVLLAGLPMKKAVATSLLIIAANSLVGFLGDVQNLTIDWVFLAGFTSLSIVGIFVGIYLNQFVDGKKLKKGFGWFVLAMGIYIIIKELG